MVYEETDKVNIQRFNVQAVVRENIKDQRFAGLENKIVYYPQCPQPRKDSQNEMRPRATVQIKCMVITLLEAQCMKFIHGSWGDIPQPG